MNHTQIVKPRHAIQVKHTMKIMWKLQIILKIFLNHLSWKHILKVLFYYFFEQILKVLLFNKFYSDITYMPTSKITKSQKHYKEHKRDSTKILKSSCLYCELET